MANVMNALKLAALKTQAGARLRELQNAQSKQSKQTAGDAVLSIARELNDGGEHELATRIAAYCALALQGEYDQAQHRL